MKTFITLVITFLSMTAFGQDYQDVANQQMTSAQWHEEAKTNIRLLPKYGHVSKTKEQSASDKDFIETTLKRFATNREASAHLIRLGFKYLYTDVKTAMYRFNQAYLLDSANTDIYWGYGGVYMRIGDLEHARKQYLEGLAIDPENTHLLTDYGTYFMAQYYALQALDGKLASIHLDTAISYLERSYQRDATDPNTSFKLSVCYYQKNNCANARKYYDACVLLGGQPITEDYTNALKKQCGTK